MAAARTMESGSFACSVISATCAERRFAGFAEHAQRGGLDLDRSGANLFHERGDGGFDGALCSFRHPR